MCENNEYTTPTKLRMDTNLLMKTKIKWLFIRTLVLISNLVDDMMKRILYLIIFSVLFSGCFIFRPKNKCADCPEWGKQKHASVKSAIVTHHS